MSHPYYRELPLTLSNLYSELFEMVVSADLHRSLGDLKGTFTKKEIKNNIYWYLQYSELGKTKQKFIGKDSPQIQELIQNFKQEKEEKANLLEKRKSLVKSIQATGINRHSSIDSKIIRMLAESGIFKLSSLLVGTNAFICYSAMLGLHFKEFVQTQDVDIVNDTNIDLLVDCENKSTSLDDILEQSKLGFIPIPGFSHKEPSTSFTLSHQEGKLDILTPMKGKPQSNPVYISKLKTYATPLRFLDLLMEKTIQCAIPYSDGLLVNIPHPIHFALHKIIVSYRRPITERIKAKKDRQQALCLLSFLREDYQEEIQKALEMIEKNWPKQISKIEKFLKDNKL